MSLTLRSMLNQDGPARYKDTFLNITGDKETKLIYCDRISDSGLGGYDKDGASVVYTTKDKVVIDIIMPHSEWKQFGRHTVLILRQPARQWKRSLSRGTHSLVPDGNVTKMDKADKASFQDALWPSLRAHDVGALTEILNDKG